ncbi:hypothetical protein [Thermofilum pendens]|uniref:hypothetical protein n=1 Tax=Thermofilum pendens TaxID=2269 RepID=UPI00069B965B|nr:hypothetical protein [Thermofilum pendens]
MGRRRVALALLAVLFLVSALSYAVKHAEAPEVFEYGSATVVYRNPVLAPPRVVVKIQGASPSDRVVVSAYIWAPSGEIKPLGNYTGTGSVELNYGRVKESYEEWARHLRSRGTDPSAVSIGMLILATIYKPEEAYATISAVPIKPSELEASRAVEVTLAEEPLPMPGKGAPQPQATQQGWPPEYIPDTQKPGFWYLKKQYYASTKGVALATVDIWGRVEKLDVVILKASLTADRTLGIRIGFSALAGFKPTGSSTVSWKIAGYAWSAEDKQGASLDYYKVFYYGSDFDKESVLAVGFYGDLAYAEYTYYDCNWYTCVPRGTANLTLARPAGGQALTNNLAWYTVEPDPWIYPYAAGETAEAYKLFYLNWNRSPEKVAQNVFTLDSINVTREVQTSPLFALSLDFVKLTLGTSPPAPLFAVSVGGESSYSASVLSFASATVTTQRNYRPCELRYKYLYSPVKYGLGGYYYPVATMYVDVYIP